MSVCTPKSFDLTGKVALITGASYGIGFAIATAMANCGATIVFNDIKQELVDKGLAAYKEAGITAHGYVCDVTNEDAVNEMVKKITEEVGVIVFSREKIPELLIRCGVFILGQVQVDMVACRVEGDDTRERRFAGDGKAHGDIGSALKVHRDKDLGLDGHDEIARARVIHTALTGIDREERDVDLLRGDRRDAVIKRTLGGFDFRDGGFIPPMPEVQIAGMEKRDARKTDEEGNAFIRRAIGMNGD